MSRKFTETITAAELARKIAEAAKKHRWSGEWHQEHINKALNAPDNEIAGFVDYDAFHFNLQTLTPQVEKDLAKIEFDTENVDGERFHTTSHGLTYFLVQAGGDWEVPIKFIIYWDGKKLRGYIPEKGNLFNQTAKSAFGNNDNDAEDAHKQWPHLFNGNDEDIMDTLLGSDIDYDMEAIKRDIEERIIRA